MKKVICLLLAAAALVTMLCACDDEKGPLKAKVSLENGKKELVTSEDVFNYKDKYEGAAVGITSEIKRIEKNLLDFYNILENPETTYSVILEDSWVIIIPESDFKDMDLDVGDTVYVTGILKPDYMRIEIHSPTIKIK